MDIQEKLKQIENYRERGENWYELACVVQEVTRSEAWRSHFTSNANWLKEAAKCSGYHPAVIRRMVRAIVFLDRMTNQEGIVLEASGEIPLASLEILERMYPLAPNRVKELLGSALKGKVTLREVQREYDQAVEKQPDKAVQTGLARRLSNGFGQRSVKAINESIQLLSGEGNTRLFDKLPTPFPSMADIFAISNNRNDVKVCDGFHIQFATGTMGNNRHNILQSIAFNCYFFRRYWIVLPEYTGIELEEFLSSKLRELELYNVAFAFLKDQPESEAPDELWDMTKSVYRPDISSPNEAGFFPLESDYIPKWTHLLLKHIVDK